MDPLVHWAAHDAALGVDYPTTACQRHTLSASLALLTDLAVLTVASVQIILLIFSSL